MSSFKIEIASFFLGRGAREVRGAGGTGQGGCGFKICNCSFLPKWDTFFVKKNIRMGEEE